MFSLLTKGGLSARFKAVTGIEIAISNRNTVKISLDRFRRAGERVGFVGDALLGGVLVAATLGLRGVGRAVPALLRRGARAAGELRASDLLALGITASAAALLIRSKLDGTDVTLEGLNVNYGMMPDGDAAECGPLLELHDLYGKGDDGHHYQGSKKIRGASPLD